MFGPTYDIAIIGGGINGAAIARDAAGRGLSVFLCEQDDLASATSSASTKLIHGGLRYLERYAFRLVHEGLAEREVLLEAAPHIIRPIRFVLPHHRGLRPRFLLRVGLFLYDHLGGRKVLPPTRSVDLTQDPAGKPLRPEYRFGFEYSDCTVDDSRFVVLNAMDARTHGAAILPRTRCVIAEREGDLWRLSLESAETGEPSIIQARTLVNAAGPWVADVLDHVVHGHARAHVRLVKGSHVVVRKLFDHDRAYIFQNSDRRIVFAIPYRQDFTLIGTTDDDYHGDPGEVAADDAEVAYLLAAASEYFRQPVTEDAVVWTYSGVRPLYDDGASKAQEATRDYVLDVDAGEGQAPVLSVFGGKITTSRKLAEHALEKLSPFVKMGAPWTKGASLPGGNFPVDGGGDVVRALRAAYPFVTEAHAWRLVSAYGTRAPLFLAGARGLADLGHVFGEDLTEAEVAWLVQEEWARTAEDVLWRRTKLGLRFTASQVSVLEAWMAEAREHVALPAV
ncbi:MAG: glycerol-3-phosphate dehydrogenase [Rhizobiales bacterium]|nr:glycerol-3-phosphate dehydrogenase [Hyphomicrobiales bacterium]